MLFFNVFKINNGVAHLWYIFEYLKIILWLPILSLFCSKTKKDEKIRRYVITIGLIYMLLNSVQMFLTGTTEYTPFIISTTAIIQVLIGYELSIKEKSLFANNKNKTMKVGIVLFVIGITARFLLQIFLYNKFLNPEYLLHTGRITNITSSLGIFLFIKSIQINEKLHNIIKYIASNTFYIYLIHYPLIMKLDSIGIKEIILRKFSTNFIDEFLFNLVYAMIIFFICFVIIIIIKQLKKVSYYIKKT